MTVVYRCQALPTGLAPWRIPDWENQSNRICSGGHRT